MEIKEEVKAGAVRKAAAARGAKGQISLHNSFPDFKGRLMSQGLLLLKLLSSVGLQWRHNQSRPLQLPSDISKCSTEWRSIRDGHSVTVGCPVLSPRLPQPPSSIIALLSNTFLETDRIKEITLVHSSTSPDNKLLTIHIFRLHHF